MRSNPNSNKARFNASKVNKYQQDPIIINPQNENNKVPIIAE